MNKKEGKENYEKAISQQYARNPFLMRKMSKTLEEE